MRARGHTQPLGIMWAWPSSCTTKRSQCKRPLPWRGRCFTTPTADGCRVTLQIVQAGRLARLARLLYGGLTQRYMRIEAEELKRHTERLASEV